MDFCFKKNIYPIVFLFLVFFYGCHSLPPSTPAGPEEQYFEPGVGLWEETSMPAELLGDWYSGGKLELTVGEDTLRVSGIWSLIQSVEKSDSYYRIIHMIEAQYFATYFLKLTQESVEVVEAKGYATDEEGAAALSEIESRHTMTSTNLWVTTGMSGDLQGNWHIHDGKMEMVMDRESVVLDGELWDIDSVQTNRTVDRLILRSGDRYKSLYFHEVGEYTMGALLVDGKEDIQDRYGKVIGEWSTLHRWWDFIEKCRLYPGSSWIYDYSYQEYYTQVYNTATPIDSIVQTNSLEGQFELEVTSSTIQEGTGSLTLQTAFQIAEEKGRYFHARKDDKIEVLTDSSWVNPGHLKTEQYELFLENDTLWYETDEGRVFFASTKVQFDGLVNIRVFIYPFTFPREGFSESRDILSKIQQNLTIPISYLLNLPSLSFDNMVSGIDLEKSAVFKLGKGFEYIYYLYGDHNLSSWSKSGYSIATNPHLKETSFYCRLLDFTSGQ